MKLYKVLKRLEDGTLISPYQRYPYGIGKKYICADFDSDPKKACSYGYYATDIDGLPYAWRDLPGHVVCECEVGGKSVEFNQFKRRYETIELIREVPHEEIKALALQWEPKVGYNLPEVLFPINPLKVECGPVTSEEIELLKQWDAKGLMQISIAHL